jgi:integrase/recombinase XerD
MQKIFMDDAVEKMTKTMELRGFATSTKKTYLGHLRRFAEFCGKHPSACGYDDVRSFLHNSINVRKLSPQFINSAYGALKFFFESALCREWNMKHIPRLKTKHTLPEILSKEEVASILNHITNLKHKAMITTIYSAGLRINEAAHLKISDIDSKNMRIFVRQGKGNKDRFTLLSKNNLLLLRNYYREYKPKEWLFPGFLSSDPISVRNIQVVFKNGVKAAGIKKKVSVHTLRHSFATHLLNQGASILQIKELLGHYDIQTTTVYLHLSNAQVLGINSPFDEGDDFNA